MAEIKIMHRDGIVHETGYKGIIRVGGRNVPVTYHQVFDLDGDFWMLSDATTGTRIRGGLTRAEARKNSLEEIEKIGADLFFLARQKFMEIAYGGKTLAEFAGKKVSKTNSAKYSAWAQKEGKAREVKR